MRDELLQQLEAWHEADDYEQIVQAVTDIPSGERDYVLVSHLGRALNNLERYEEAVEQFLTVVHEGAQDALWHYRLGLAYYYLEKYDKARQAFQAADRLEPGDEDTLEFLRWIEEKEAEAAEAGENQAAGLDKAQEVMGSDVESGTQGNSASVLSTYEASLDSSGFWDDANPAAEKYVSTPAADELVVSLEEELVFRLPASYVSLMKTHNGGIPRRRYYPVTDVPASKIEILGILGIGRDKPHSLGGAAGSRATIERDGYPEFGVVLCDTPSDTGVVMLDYREFGNDGEPEVVYVEKASKQVTRLAASFADFIQGLTEE
ncbi:SMI1/KNR4 family protein [Paenibacillus senegalimassiliensis]|uniref:SMI1/KNR4 family protein n=1 Tax=Paenibacillus senegalimassiliensis TaxID=1737426 RepID=UPI00073EEC9E|nr:SMI1/KNR4 family protein [Paenibacillus senegalimassiliensis]